eukprot:2055366-Rhodomonas_salina.1
MPQRQRQTVVLLMAQSVPNIEISNSDSKREPDGAEGEHSHLRVTNSLGQGGDPGSRGQGSRV